MSDGPYAARISGPVAAVELVASLFPAFCGATARTLGQGWDYQAFLIDETWVFRFPKDASSDRIALEAAMLDALGPALPVPVPRYEFVGRPRGAFPWTIGGYRFLPGMPAMALDGATDALHCVARRVGEFLACLHALPTATVASFGLPETRVDQSLAARRDWTLAEAADIPRDALREAAVTYLEDEAHLPPEYDGPPRILHNDLGPEHILLDSAEPGTVAAVIDWSDAAIGDPAQDFAGLRAWLPSKAFHRAVDAYGGPPDPGFVTRTRYIGICNALGDWSYGLRTGEHRYTAYGRDSLRRLV